MRSIRLAEWILSLVTAPDRATSTAGDLAEERATRGPIWFWDAILRTVASHVWRGIAETPARVTGLAFLGAIVEVTAEFVGAFLSGVIFFFAAWWGAHPIQWHSPFWTIVSAIPSLITSLIIGRILARWAVDREVATCLVYVILTPTCSLIIDPPEGLGVLSVVAGFLGTVALQTPALAGAVWGRRHRLRALRPRHIEG
jgi:hypothetical protein